MNNKPVIEKKAAKKRVVTSYENLSSELVTALKERYPLGFTDNMIRVDKPNGDFFYGVVFETEDTNYLVKISVKVDNKAKEDIEKDLFADEEIENDEIKGADEISEPDSDED